MSGDAPQIPETPRIPETPQGPVRAAGRAEHPGRDDWRTTFRPDIPSSARIYDYFLGGKDNYPADRQAAQQITSYLPNIREAARINRAFVRRAVRYLVNEVGIRQLIDIGAGLPTMGNVHEVAIQANPAARVVYVDHDPVVLAHARDMLQGVPNADAAPQVHDAARVYDVATTRMYVRGRAEMLALVRGLELVEPGLVWTPEWHPEPGEHVPERPSDCYYYALVARQP